MSVRNNKSRSKAHLLCRHSFDDLNQMCRSPVVQNKLQVGIDLHEKSQPQKSFKMCDFALKRLYLIWTVFKPTIKYETLNLCLEKNINTNQFLNKKLYTMYYAYCLHCINTLVETCDLVCKLFCHPPPPSLFCVLYKERYKLLLMSSV